VQNDRELAPALALAGLTVPFAAANTILDDEQAAARSSFEFNEKDSTLSIEWSGAIVPGMADYLRTALDSGQRPWPRLAGCSAITSPMLR
jgi:hypothetical protein